MRAADEGDIAHLDLIIDLIGHIERRLEGLSLDIFVADSRRGRSHRLSAGCGLP